MSLFSELIDGTEAASIKTGLRWIGSCLGVARDLDVMAADLQQRRTGAVPPEILKRLDRKRRHAHDDVRQALQSPRFQSLLLDTVAWVESGNGSAPKGGLAKKLREQPVFARATEELGRRQRKLARDCTHLERLSPAERHALRIRAKRLRYAVEFFGDLFGGTKSAHRCKALLSALKELQSTLGDLNDIANRDRLMLEITAPADGELPGVTAAALYRPAARSARLLAAASDAGHRISKAKPFWH
jgi:triphosphatase